jgi:hypothetical protein
VGESKLSRRARSEFEVGPDTGSRSQRCVALVIDAVSSYSMSYLTTLVLALAQNLSELAILPSGLPIHVRAYYDTHASVTTGK